MPITNLYPTVGVGSRNGILQVNFGQLPFSYNIAMEQILQSSHMKDLERKKSKTSRGSVFENSKHNAVYNLVTSCTRDEGLDRYKMMQTLSDNISRMDLDDALDFLRDEGHIYATIDDDHFKATDG